jgi:uncharacterized membrane protein YgdD (TMEM256/DUF423 family)
METLFIIGSICGGLAVVLGAFGAHALKSRLTTQRLQTFETAVRYQMYHALALLLAAFATIRWPDSEYPHLAGWLFILGTVLFSGSLYILTFSNRRQWGAVAPLGGVSMLAGWVCLAITAI